MKPAARKPLGRCPARLSNRNGQALVVLAGSIAFIITVAGVAADVANIFTTKAKIQRAADAAAMAGLTYYLEHLDEPTAQADANKVSRRVADLNLLKMGLMDKKRAAPILNIDNPMYGNTITNTLSLGADANTVFLQILGAKAKRVNVTAVAQSVPAIVSLLLDTSNSMDNIEFQFLKEGAIAFIKQFQPKLDRIAIISFNAYATIERPMGMFTKHEELEEIIGATFDQGIQRGDGTNLTHAIERGREEIERVAGTKAVPKNNVPKDAIKAMVIFSDGAPNVMRGRFKNALQRHGVAGDPDTGAARRGILWPGRHNGGQWDGPLPMHNITTPSTPAPGIDIDATPAPFEYWYYFYWRQPYPVIVTLFNQATDISNSQVTNSSRLVPCEKPAPYDLGARYLDTGWTCLEDFSYNDSRGVEHGKWIQDYTGYWADGVDARREYPSGEPSFVHYVSVYSWNWRMESGQGHAFEEVYNSAIYESDYAKEDGITIYIIALGTEVKQTTAYCPSEGKWKPVDSACEDTFTCRNGVKVSGKSNQDCPDDYCKNPDGSYRARLGESDHCCWNGSTSGACPFKYTCPDSGKGVMDLAECNPIELCPDGTPKDPVVPCKKVCWDGSVVNPDEDCPVCWDGNPPNAAGQCPKVRCWDPDGPFARYLVECPPPRGE